MSSPPSDQRRLRPGYSSQVRTAAARQVAPPPAAVVPGAVVPARPSATVVLLRDGADGVQVFLLRRVPAMAFAAGMHVFPGGVVDSRDEHLPTSCWAGPPAESWSRVLTAPPSLAGALVCAAVRETFEETGVVLAARASRSARAAPAAEVVADVSGPGWETDRQALLDGSVPLAELLARRRLQLCADLLRPWSHWITPEGEPRRYDTRFFVAAMPVGQRTRHVGGEADAVGWWRPQQALDAAAAGELALMPPTALTLGELTPYPTVAAVLAAADQREITPVLPRIVGSGDDVAVLLPGEPGYDQ